MSLANAEEHAMDTSRSETPPEPRAWERRRETLLAEGKKKRASEIAQVRRRLRWSSPCGLSEPDLCRLLMWPAGTAHGHLRELADDGEIHEREGVWYSGGPAGAATMPAPTTTLDIRRRLLEVAERRWMTRMELASMVTGAPLADALLTITALVAAGELQGEDGGPRVRLRAQGQAQTGNAVDGRHVRQPATGAESLGSYQAPVKSEAGGSPGPQGPAVQQPPNSVGDSSIGGDTSSSLDSGATAEREPSHTIPRAQDELLTALRRFPEGATVADLARASGVNSNALRQRLYDLRDAGAARWNGKNRSESRWFPALTTAIDPRMVVREIVAERHETTLRARVLADLAEHPMAHATGVADRLGVDRKAVSGALRHLRELGWAFWPPGPKGSARWTLTRKGRDAVQSHQPSPAPQQAELQPEVDRQVDGEINQGSDHAVAEGVEGAGVSSTSTAPAPDVGLSDVPAATVRPSASHQGEIVSGTGPTDLGEPSSTSPVGVTQTSPPPASVDDIPICPGCCRRHAGPCEPVSVPAEGVHEPDCWCFDCVPDPTPPPSPTVFPGFMTGVDERIDRIVEVLTLQSNRLDELEHAPIRLVAAQAVDVAMNLTQQLGQLERDNVALQETLERERAEYVDLDRRHMAAVAELADVDDALTAMHVPLHRVRGYRLGWLARGGAR